MLSKDNSLKSARASKRKGWIAFGRLNPELEQSTTHFVWKCFQVTGVTVSAGSVEISLRRTAHGMARLSLEISYLRETGAIEEVSPDACKQDCALDIPGAIAIACLHNCSRNRGCPDFNHSYNGAAGSSGL
jgi:hypothetical protein